MRIKSASLGLMAMCAVLTGCNSQNEQSPAGNEDAGQYPDTTATEGNMILPSDDADMAPTTSETMGAAPSAGATTGL